MAEINVQKDNGNNIGAEYHAGLNLKRVSLRKASPWRRVLAYLIDINSSNGAATVMLWVSVVLAQKMSAGLHVQRIIFSAGLFVYFVIGNWLYSAKFEASRFQATPGKIFLSCRVKDENGGELSFSLATKRFFLKVVSFLTLGIAFLPAFFGNAPLQDMFSGTQVVEK